MGLVGTSPPGERNGDDNDDDNDDDDEDGDENENDKGGRQDVVSVTPPAADVAVVVAVVAGDVTVVVKDPDGLICVRVPSSG